MAPLDPGRVVGGSSLIDPVTVGGAAAANAKAMCDKISRITATQDSLAAAVVTQKSRGDLVESSLRLLVDVGGEADAAALRSRRVHQFADGRENGGDCLVMVLKLAFEFVELAGQGGVRGQ